jgi:hypothetical protein
LIGRPFDKLLCLGTIVAIVLDVQEHLGQAVGRLGRQEPAKDALRQLIVFDCLTSHLTHRLHDLAVRVEPSGRREDLALVLFRLGEDGANILARVTDGVNERELSLGLDEVGKGVGAVAGRMWRHHPSKVLHERPWCEECALDRQGADVLFYIGLSVKMVYILELAPRNSARVRERAEDEVMRACGNGRVCHCLSLADFPPLRQVVVDGDRDGKYGVRALHGLLEGFLVIRIALDDLNALLQQSLGSGLGEVARNAANIVLLGQFRVIDDIIDEGTALLACGTEDDEELAHFGDIGKAALWRWCWCLEVVVEMLSGGLCSKPTESWILFMFLSLVGCAVALHDISKRDRHSTSAESGNPEYALLTPGMGSPRLVGDREASSQTGNVGHGFSLSDVERVAGYWKLVSVRFDEVGQKWFGRAFWQPS